MSKDTTQINRQITKISIDSDMAVIIGFTELIPTSGDIIDPKSKGNGTEDEEEEVDDLPARCINHTIEAPWRPHKDFVEAMKKLKRFAIDICEMPGLTDFTVSKVKISGDVLLNQSRVVMVISKKVKRSDKLISITTPQVTMYGESEYDKAKEMSKAIEALLDEAWLYIEGKYSSEEGQQLPLFTKQELVLT